ncbi:CENP-B homolog protein 2-like protein [Tanacetum coccineum]
MWGVGLSDCERFGLLWEVKQWQENDILWGYRKCVNFRTLITPARNGIDVAVSVDSIRVISKRFVNTAYSFFLRKRVAYPIVANYVRNTWGKYGLVISMLNSSTGLFLFQFSYVDGLDPMLENGSWFIRNNPLILKKWDPNVNLLIEDVVNVPVWVKLHGVPVTAFSEDGLSVIATKLGTPLCFELLLHLHLHESRDLKELNLSMGDVTFVDDEGKPLKKVDSLSDHDISVDSLSDHDISVDNEMASFLTSKKVGYSTNSILEQWKETYENVDYDYDTYDDDMYEGSGNSLAKFNLYAINLVYKYNMTFENSDEGGESTQELQNLIKELGYRNAMDVEDVLTHPEENVVAQLLTDEEIIESVIGINKDDIDEEDDESSTMEPPSRNEAIKAAITLNNFLLSYEKTTPEVLTMLRKIRDEIQGEIDFNKKQKTIESFFKKPS